MAGRIRAKQLEDGGITEAKLASALETTLIRTDGSATYTSDQPFGTNKITGLGDPTAAQDAATKAYVDSVATGLTDAKESVRVATAAALPANTPSGGPGVGRIITADAVGVLTVDGVATVLGDRILVQDEASSDDGIYEVTTEGTAGVAFVLTRATDADEDAEVTAGMYVFVEEGTANGDKGFLMTNNDPFTVDTDTPTFVQFSTVGAVTAADDTIDVTSQAVKAARPVTDDKQLTASVTASDFDAGTASTITKTPAGDSIVYVDINGVSVELGDGVKTKDCYFSGDGGTTARAISAIVAGDAFHWVGSVAGFELDATDRIDWNYNNLTP